MASTSVRPPVGELTDTVTLVHEVLLKCSNTGELFRCKPSLNAMPAAQTSEGDDPEIEVMSKPGCVEVMGSLVVVHVEPLKCSASPPELTDHTFLAENALTGPSVTLAGMVMVDHEVPLKWKATDTETSNPPVLMMPPPTAVMLSADVPVMKLKEHWLLTLVHIPGGSPCPVQLIPFQCSNGSPVAPPTAQTSVGEAA